MCSTYECKYKQSISGNYDATLDPGQHRILARGSSLSPLRKTPFKVLAKDKVLLAIAIKVHVDLQC